MVSLRGGGAFSHSLQKQRGPLCTPRPCLGLTAFLSVPLTGTRAPTPCSVRRLCVLARLPAGRSWDSGGEDCFCALGSAPPWTVRLEVFSSLQLFVISTELGDAEVFHFGESGSVD